MDSELVAAIQDVARLQKHMRAVLGSLRQLQDVTGSHLGTFELAAGEQIDAMEVIAFLRLTVGENTDRAVRITVTAPQLGTDQGEPHEQDEVVRRGRPNPRAARGAGHDRRADVLSREADTGRAA